MALENDTGDKMQAQIEVSAAESTETVNVLTPEENLETVKNLFVEGKRHLVCGNYAEAVDCLDECCRLYAKRYGEMSAECVDPYFYYGKSLLELERTKDQKVLEQKEEAEGSEESGIDDEEGGEELGQTAENNNSGDIVDENEVPVVQEVVDQEKKTEEIPNAGETSENGAAVVETSELSPEGTGDVDVDEPKEKNSTGLEVAWEMVDLARVILEKEPSDNENRLRLANCRMVLGEINFANEAFQGAVDEFHACLEIYNTILPADDRKLSETYFQIGSSYDLDSQFGLAGDSFKKAISILELRKSNLEKIIDDQTKTDADKEESKKEINDLSVLIVEMTQRMNDTLDCERQKNDAKKALDECTGKINGDTNGANGDGGNSHDATDVSHLVRKQTTKRPAEEIIVESDESKRTKIGNGDGVAEKGCALINLTEEIVSTTTNGSTKDSPIKTTNGHGGGDVSIQETVTTIE